MTSDNGKHTLVVDECQIDKDEGEYTVKFNKELKSTAKLLIKGKTHSLFIPEDQCERTNRGLRQFHTVKQQVSQRIVTK